jgi:hypothetical protein
MTDKREDTNVGAGQMRGDSPVNEDGHDGTVGVLRAWPWRVVGIVLFAAVVGSWFVWGPFGVIFYVGGLFNSIWTFAITPLLFLLIPLAAMCLPVLGVHTLWRWRRLTDRQKCVRPLLVVASAALVASFAVGFTGVTPVPNDMFMRGFAGYVERRADVKAIQSWLATLDPNDCEGQALDAKVAPGVHLQDPPKYMARPLCLARFRSGGARLHRDDAGRPLVRLIWGGGMIGHWGIEVGDVTMEGTPDEYHEYRRLAPGAYIWYELQ